VLVAITGESLLFLPSLIGGKSRSSTSCTTFCSRTLQERSIFELVTLKGGTALRKIFAGSQGLFSTDIDLAGVKAGARLHAFGRGPVVQPP
jgi:hypothetical protein